MHQMIILVRCIKWWWFISGASDDGPQGLSAPAAFTPTLPSPWCAGKEKVWLVIYILPGVLSWRYSRLYLQKDTNVQVRWRLHFNLQFCWTSPVRRPPVSSLSRCEGIFTKFSIFFPTIYIRSKIAPLALEIFWYDSLFQHVSKIYTHW